MFKTDYIACLGSSHQAAFHISPSVCRPEQDVYFIVQKPSRHILVGLKFYMNKNTHTHTNAYYYGFRYGNFVLCKGKTMLELTNTSI
jgi:hypothetical protein